MIYEGLNSLRRNAVMTTIILLAFGIILLIMPERLLPTLIIVGGSVMLIIALGMIFDFLGSKRALINYIFLTAAIALGIGGIAVLIFIEDVLFVLGFFFGLFLLLVSIHGIFHSWVYARRSERRGWWVLIPLYVLQIVMGLLIMINPWWRENGEFKQIIGLAIVFASIVSALRVFWVWPIRKV